MPKLKIDYFFTLIIFVGLLSRFISYYFFRDQALTNEWKILFENYKNFKIIGIHIYDGIKITQSIASVNDIVLPSIYMPPFYLFYIVFFNYFIGENYLVNLIILSQIFLSIISSYFMFKILNKFFIKKVSLAGMLIFLLYPLNIYSSSKISSVTLQVFFIILYFYLFLKFLDEQNFRNLIFLSLTSSALLLLRGEFILIFIFSLFFVFFKTRNFKIIMLAIFFTLLIISPYLIRNYLVFEKITITKSLGFNLWKGNNIYSKVEGSEKLYDNEMIEQIKKIKVTKFYELEKDEIYKQNALKNISENPKKYARLFLKKIIAFLFFDYESSYPNYYNLLNLLPKILIGLISIIGIFKIRFNNIILIYFSSCYILNLLLYSTFFILPRYQLGVLPLQIILCCVFFENKNLKLEKFFN